MTEALGGPDKMKEHEQLLAIERSKFECAEQGRLHLQA